MKDSQLVLRPLMLSEVETVFGWINDSAVVGEFVSTGEFSKEMLVTFASNQGRLGDDFFWVLTDSKKNLLGYAHCWPCDRYEDHIEFGRVLLPEYRQQGLGVLFLKLILDKIFTETTAHRIQAITAAGNKAVMKNWKQCGFLVEGELRDYMTLNGKRVNAIVGSVLRSDWKNH